MLETLVDRFGVFDLERATGRKPQRLPRALRCESNNTCTCDLLVAAFHDPAVDPRSGGVIGTPGIARILGWTHDHTQRELREHAGFGFVRCVGDVWASHVSSLQNFRTSINPTYVSELRSLVRGMRP